MKRVKRRRSLCAPLLPVSPKEWRVLCATFSLFLTQKGGSSLRNILPFLPKNQGERDPLCAEFSLFPKEDRPFFAQSSPSLLRGIPLCAEFSLSPKGCTPGCDRCTQGVTGVPQGVTGVPRVCMVGIYLRVCMVGIYLRVVYLREAIPQGVLYPGRLYLRVYYASLCTMVGIYASLCTMVGRYLPVYTWYIPPCTPWVYPRTSRCLVYRSSCPVCVPLPADGALGSNLGITMGGRLSDPSGPQECERRWEPVAHSYSALPV